MHVTFGVLGATAAWDGTGEPLPLKGPAHRAVLARLIVARRRVVPVSRLVADLWEEPPEDAVGTVRTFVAGLRRALEPDRRPRAPARLLVTEGPGYALRAGTEDVDAWWFERAVDAVAALPPARVPDRLTEALGRWRGPAYADFGGAAWARAERSRLTELRLLAVERRAEALVALGASARAVAELDAHVVEHPWREDGWRLLALALYRSGRQADALSVLRRARRMLREELGMDPGPRLRRLEHDVLHQELHLDPDPDPGPEPAGLGPDLNVDPAADPAGPIAPTGPTGAGDPATRVWTRATSAYDRAAPALRLQSTVGLMRDLAVTGGGGLVSSRRHRVAAVAAAEELGDPELTARVIGAYDVPAVWTRSDDPAQAKALVDAAERTLRALPADGHAVARCRLLATIAVESRGTLPTGTPGTPGTPGAAGTPGAPGAPGTSARPLQAARQAEELARERGDAALLAFALNGTFMQSFARAGLAARRDAIGAELIALSARHELVRHEVLGHLVRMQARAALADPTGAARHATAADALADRHGLPLVGVFTTWSRALRTALTEPPEAARAAYRRAAAVLEGAGMPGLEHGLLPLALLSVDVRHGVAPTVDPAADWGPYEPWVRPLLLAEAGRTGEARAALRTLPSPPRDLLFEALWALVGRAATAVDEPGAIARAHAQLAPAATELAGAGSGLLSLGPVAAELYHLAAHR
ncbi:BTAD domain-containing putative transcriptional regulator [Streptomyces sp. NPDC091377]|uniref:AfsR/SARP family transcriptional regulator n=1 Tax=Streptomyces sp. NPDC091377 TaxID=3365995 RepID=UPI0038116449